MYYIYWYFLFIFFEELLPHLLFNYLFNRADLGYYYYYYYCFYFFFKLHNNNHKKKMLYDGVSVGTNTSSYYYMILSIIINIHYYYINTRNSSLTIKYPTMVNKEQIAIPLPLQVLV